MPLLQDMTHFARTVALKSIQMEAFDWWLDYFNPSEDSGATFTRQKNHGHERE